MELTKKDKFINNLLKEGIFLFLKEFGETSDYELAHHFNITIQRTLALCHLLVIEERIEMKKGFSGRKYFKVLTNK